jgi:hypothetical protein
MRKSAASLVFCASSAFTRESVLIDDCSHSIGRAFSNPLPTGYRALLLPTLLLPLDVQLLKDSLVIPLDVLIRPRHQGTDLNLPPFPGILAKHPRNLPQRHLGALLIDVVHPHGRLVDLDADGDALLAVAHGGLPVGAAGDGGDAPIGEAVAADDREAGLVLEELDAGFDPFGLASSSSGGVGDLEVEAGLVEFGGVGGVEGGGGGAEG